MANLTGSLLSIIYNIILIYMLLEFEVKPKKNLYLMGLFVTVVLICDACLENFRVSRFHEAISPSH